MTPRGNNLVTTVEELINPVTGYWDEDLNKDLFWPVDVHWILQISLSVGREDLVSWHYNRNGFFSVCSAYHIQWSRKFGGNTLHVHASGVGDTVVWGKLCQLQVASKIKIFWLEGPAWRYTMQRDS